MSTELHGFPFWTLEYEKNASPVDATALEIFVAQVAQKKLTDVYIFSHGWNNDRKTALGLYDRYFAEVRKIVDARGISARIGVAGVIWPSILWPDDAASSAMDMESASMSGGAVSLGVGQPPQVAKASLDEVAVVLRNGYDTPEQQELIDQLIAELKAGEDSDNVQGLKTFQEALAKLLTSEGAPERDNASPDAADGGVGSMDHEKFLELLSVMGDQMPRDSVGGAAGLFDGVRKLWNGAKDVLRVATYWQMKQRAGVVGRQGLGSLIEQLHAQAPSTNVHLIGHSFGARLVSYALSGLPADLVGAKSPVKSLLLLQGAFSHFAFADALPHDRQRSGALKGMATRVDGPLVATHSRRDLAVGRAYPIASFVNGDDAAAAQDQAERWGGMGSDGAQAVEADDALLGDVGATYPFAPGKWVNLDGNAVIVRGGLPSGAHSDIVHPHTAWAALAAAKLV